MVNSLEGMVLSRDGSTYRVGTAAGEVTAVLRGRAKRDDRDRVVVGDRVELDLGDQSGTFGIIRALPRRNLLERRAPDGRGARPVAANIDRVFVMTAVANPAPIPQLLDRLLVIAAANEIPADVILNKIDLAPAEELGRRFERAGYRVWRISARNDVGVADLKAQLAGHLSLLTGPSGVGKSSLLNRIQPELGLRTRELSAKIGRGRNTTVSAVMVPLDEGGYLVDTPGFSDAGLWGIEPRELARCFPEIALLVERCKFPDCRHRTEPGCAVRRAVEEEAVAADRYQSYCTLLDELEGAPREWE